MSTVMFSEASSWRTASTLSRLCAQHLSRAAEKPNCRRCPEVRKNPRPLLCPVDRVAAQFFVDGLPASWDWQEKPTAQFDLTLNCPGKSDISAREKDTERVMSGNLLFSLGSDQVGAKIATC